MPKVKGATGGKRSVGLHRLQGIRFFGGKGFQLVAYGQKPRGFPLYSNRAFFPVNVYLSCLPNREIDPLEYTVHVCTYTY